MDSRTLATRCSRNTCHCDWRLTIYGCDEQTGAYIINMINIAFSALVSCVGIAILIHRLGIKGHRLFEWGSNKGCLRPMPIDCMLFFLTIFNILRLLSSALLVADANAGNWVARSFVFEFGWQFGYGSFALYLIGIAQTLADSHKTISNGWLPSPQTVDAIGLTFFFTPFILNNIASLLTGFLAKNVYIAEIFIRLLYVLWFVHCTSLACAVMFSGLRLIRILNRHLAKFQTPNARSANIRAGIFKIRAIVVIIGVCLMSFAAFLLLYGCLRDQIMTSTVGSLILCSIWNFLGPLTTLAVEAAVLFNPSTDGKSNIFGLKASSTDKSNSMNGSTGMYDTHFSTFASGQDASFQGTLSHNAFDELKQQHLQYQRTYQQHQADIHYQQHYYESDLAGPNMDGGDENNTGGDYHHQQQQHFHNSVSPPTPIYTSDASIPLEDVDYMKKTSKLGLIQQKI